MKLQLFWTGTLKNEQISPKRYINTYIQNYLRSKNFDGKNPKTKKIIFKVNSFYILI